MATPKQEEIKVRVTDKMKARVVALAEQRGESESVIVREALQAYLLRDDKSDVETRPARPEASVHYSQPLPPGNPLKDSTTMTQADAVATADTTVAVPPEFQDAQQQVKKELEQQKGRKPTQ